VGKIAREAGVPLVVDNTVPSPYLCGRSSGVRTSLVHSATKYIGGHGTTMGGIIVESGKFPWDNGKFPNDRALARLPWRALLETFGDFGYTMRAAWKRCATFGPAISPFNSWMLLQGLETLPVRMERHCTNTLAVAKFLEQHPRVSWVNYPGCPTTSYYKLAQKYLPKGRERPAHFGVKGGAKAGKNSSRRDLHAAISRTSATRKRSSSTRFDHASTDVGEEQAKAGVTPDMIRISVGLETLDDILWDIDNALSITAKRASG